MTKVSNLSSPHSLFQAQNAPKSVLGAHDAPPNPLVGWGGGYPLLARRLRRLDPVLRPPQHKILATPVITAGSESPTMTVRCLLLIDLLKI